MIDFSSFFLGAAVCLIIFGAGLVIGMIIGFKIAEGDEIDDGMEI